MNFLSIIALDPPNAHLKLTGELDAFAAVQLRERVYEAVADGCLDYAVDASEVTFIDAGGLGALVGLTNKVTPLGGSVVVCAASTTFRWVADLARLGSAFGLDDLPSGVIQAN